VTIVGAATQRENVNKLKRAGADTVISPAALGAHFLAESALGGEGVEELERRLLAEKPSKDGPARDVLESEGDAEGGGAGDGDDTLEGDDDGGR
jgi:voltage-gated potassium channel